MIILKFGGSSLASPGSMRHIKEILLGKKEPFLVVVSAIGKTTDRLDDLAAAAEKGNHARLLGKIRNEHFGWVRSVIPLSGQNSAFQAIEDCIKDIEQVCKGISFLQELTGKAKARILGTGERMSSLLLHQYLRLEGFDLRYIDSSALIRARGNVLEAAVDMEETEKRIRENVSVNENAIAPGFIASNEQDEPVLLGRGGSDYTAALFAAALEARALELWSNVNGMMNAHPGMVREAGTIDRLSYMEAFELAYFGARVLYPPAVRPVMKKGIPLYLKNTSFPRRAGTLITAESPSEPDKIKGISSLTGISLITVSGVGLAGTRGIARRVFQAVEEAGVNVILITQACSEQGICLGVNQHDASRAVDALNRTFYREMEANLVNPVEVSENHSIIAAVGDHMRQQVGLSGKLFGALGENGINVVAIAQGASERNVSVVVDHRNEAKALQVIHERFFRKAVKRVHLFVAGTGQVGSEFLKLVFRQQALLLKEHNLELNIMGVANSRKMLTDRNGLTEKAVMELSRQGEDYGHFSRFIRTAIGMNLRNTVFVDNTASPAVSRCYLELLQHSVSVVTCNKIAPGGEYAQYQLLKHTAREKNCHFRFETCVGAALPVIKTIRDLLLSGDRIDRIEAVLSGSLNFIFNRYDARRSFASVVKEAMEAGYTEPDPRIDLSGTDVKRKILILSREAGYRTEPREVHFGHFIPETLFGNGSVNDFLFRLDQEEYRFAQRFRLSKQHGTQLRVIAGMNQGRVRVSLQEVRPGSFFYGLGGKDNLVALTTARYCPEPLIIKGAGAGAEVTASGVFSDVMLIMNR